MAITHSYRDTQAPRIGAHRAKASAASAVYDDIHPGVYKAFVGCWAALIAIFVATFAESAYTLYMLAVIVGYAVMFFGVPYVMSRVAPPATSVGQASFRQFLRGQVETAYGRVSGMEALIQILMVPLALTLGALAIGNIVHLEANHIHTLYIGQTAAYPQ